MQNVASILIQFYVRSISTHQPFDGQAIFIANARCPEKAIQLIWPVAPINQRPPVALADRREYQNIGKILDSIGRIERGPDSHSCELKT